MADLATETRDKDVDHHHLQAGMYSKLPIDIKEEIQDEHDQVLNISNNTETNYDSWIDFIPLDDNLQYVVKREFMEDSFEIPINYGYDKTIELSLSEAENNQKPDDRLQVPKPLTRTKRPRAAKNDFVKDNGKLGNQF